MKIKRNNLPITFVQLSKETGEIIKQKLIKKNGPFCPILQKIVPEKNLVVDHKHKLKNQKAGPNGRGLIRGLIDFRVNSLEGIILKKYKKSGLMNEISLIDFLRNLADYLENPPIEQKYIHWTEKIKSKIFKKSEYNRIIKYYKIMFPRSRKIPEYPKSGIKYYKTKDGKIKYRYKAKLSKKWEILLKKTNELHERKKK